jgi:hypothetical protein
VYKRQDLVGGVIPTAQIPAIAITEYLGSVASQSAMLALNGDRGDWCLRSDLGTTWILADDDSSLLASWIQLSYPTAPVTSVAGRTGAVTLANTDISGLGTLSTQNGTFSGTHSGTSSGTNTGDQTISLTGDVTGSGAGSFVTTIGAGKITNSMLAGSIALSKLSITGTPDGTKFLRDDGTWQASSGGSPGGSSGQLQYNNAVAFGGAAAVVYAGSGAHLTTTSQSSAVKCLRLIAAASQSVEVFSAETSAGVVGFSLRSDARPLTKDTLYFDDTNGWISRTAASNTMQFSPSLSSAAMKLTNATLNVLVASITGLSASAALTTFIVSPADRGGNTGVGISLKLIAGEGSTATTGSAGGSVNISGAVARGSGNNNGGDVVLSAGVAGTGSGRTGLVILANLPTSSPGVTGAIWNDGGTLKIS